ncbi:type II secretion system protein GspE [Candidatus Peregrinibacteria bacterium]|nr:type II secretion system protein GspE [Candidatus Peregrinibacteria bacterium]
MADKNSGTTDLSAAQAAAQAGSKTEDNPIPAGTKPVEEVNREFQEKSTLKRAKELGLPYIDIARTPLNPDFLKIIDIQDAKEGRIIPFFSVGKKVRVAVDDKNNPETKKIIKKLEDRGYDVNINLASSAGIDDALDIYDSSQVYKKKKIVESVEEKDIQTYEKEIADLADLPEKLDKVTAEEGLNLINIGAMKTKASDVHFEPEEETVPVRFRIDGVLHKVFELPPKIYSKISEQLKYQSGMQLNVATIPQDGRYVFIFNKRKVAVRVASIPTPYGEAFVCRYLPAGKKFLTFEELGFQGLALKKLEKASNISQGMVLVTGPTGSGKSTTLYSVLSKMNNPENKIITLEDPVEYYMQGVTQSQINEKKDYTFANGLRSILRHDPDIVMIGEIRDLKTAETAAQAALTGHVLLSTLHTNSAIESIPRLINMGLPPFMVAPALNTVVAQRLVRRVCEKCSTLEPVSESEKNEFKEIFENLKKVNPGTEVEVPEKIPKVHGCDACSNTGYKGRVVIAEVITITSEIKDLILNNSSSVDLIKAARKEGIVTLREDGFIKAAQGVTTLEEVHRVTNVAM